MTDGTDVQRLADELAIRDVLHRYALALDRQDAAMLRACFTEDVEAEYGGHRLPRGVESVLKLNQGAARFVSTMHHVGTIVVTALGENTAETEHYALALLLSQEADGSHALTTRGVHYADRFRREDGAWRIAHRVHSVRWSTRTEAVANPTLPAEFLKAVGAG